MSDLGRTPEVNSLIPTELEPPCNRDAPTGGVHEDGNDKHGHSSTRPAPPDGGLVAWLQVAGSFALYFNTL